jgi:hypothetical protein
MHQHTFRWQGKRVVLVYCIEWTVRGLQLIVDDVCTGSLEIVNGLPVG